jgi:hypothetical protein
MRCNALLPAALVLALGLGAAGGYLCDQSTYGY